MVHNIADITPNGTATALSSSHTKANWVIVSSPAANGAAVRVGDSTTSASSGAIAEKGASITLWPIGDDLYLDLALIFVFAASGSDKAGVLYGTH
jgi:hypothetical protein